MTWEELGTLLGMILAVVVILFLAYFAARYVAGRGMGGRAISLDGRNGNIRLLERVPMGREQSLVVVEVGGAYLLLGVTAAGITLLHELNEEESAPWKEASAPNGTHPPMRFQDALAEVLKKKKM